MIYNALKLTHVLSIIVWIGGMFFAHFCLRPAAQQLEPPQRVRLMHGVLQRFLGAVAVACKHEIVLAIVGGLFVAEALSVIIQVAYFKRTGRRVFLMAPIHHHFEKLGWAESTVVIRFWIVAIVLAMLGLATLKLR